MLLQVQSVIQPTQQSVIQSATNIPMQISKGNVILLSKPTNSVIHTTQVKYNFAPDIYRLFHVNLFNAGQFANAAN